MSDLLKQRSSLAIWNVLKWVCFLSLLIGCLTLVYNLFLTFRIRITTDAMKPTLVAGQYTRVQKHGTFFQPQLARGDLVLLSGMDRFSCLIKPKALIVRRIVGIPGDTITLSSKYILINGKSILEYPTLSEVTGNRYQMAPNNSLSSFLLPTGTIMSLSKDEYFVLTDKTFACDSMVFGKVSSDAIMGKVLH